MGKTDVSWNNTVTSKLYEPNRTYPPIHIFYVPLVSLSKSSQMRKKPVYVLNPHHF